VTCGRGGYCFEHNLLLYDVLIQLKLACTLRLARVLVHEAPTGFTHCVLLVTIDGCQRLVDMGFGTRIFSSPLRLDPNVFQQVGTEILHVVTDDSGRVVGAGGYVLRAFRWDALASALESQDTPTDLMSPEYWQELYAINNCPVLPIDLILGNHYVRDRARIHKP
jgi:N-hydroxyarylamine O-acetyltransferase